MKVTVKIAVDAGAATTAAVTVNRSPFSSTRPSGLIATGVCNVAIEGKIAVPTTAVADVSIDEIEAALST